MKAERVDICCIAIKLPTNEIHPLENGESVIYRNLSEAVELANSILDAVQDQPTQTKQEATF